MAAWAIPVFCVGEFLRVVTHPRVVSPPFTAAEADGRAIGNLVFDAQVVAVCREAGVTALLTEERDFARFPGLRIRRLS
jgi:predicted nucleic acid-binding protein